VRDCIKKEGTKRAEEGKKAAKRKNGGRNVMQDKKKKKKNGALFKLGIKFQAMGKR